jgi:hypothetical protein
MGHRWWVMGTVNVAAHVPITYDPTPMTRARGLTDL